MSEQLAPTLPVAFKRVLDDGEAGVGAGLAFQLLTVDGDGWAHASMVSVGEVVAVDSENLRLALWPGSRAAANCAARRRATLAAVVDAVGYSVRLKVSPSARIPNQERGELHTFDASVVEVRADVAPYAHLESGIRFRLLDPDAVLSRWAETRRLLRGQD